MKKKPNIVVVMTDDHGQWAARCYGNREIRTPNMDVLAERGTVMENAYTPSPVCSPARACFFTGKLPSQHGLHDYLTEAPDEEHYDWLHGLETLPAALQRQGYRTGLVGKWHCGASWKARPEFDYWFSYMKGQYPHFGDHDFVENCEVYHAYGHQTPVLTEKALDCMDNFSESDDPFFLFVGYVDTHSPFIDHPERLVSYYREQATFCDIPDETPVVPEGGWFRFGVPADPVERREWLAQYYAAAEFIDEQLGMLMDRLEALGELDNTVFVYTSDHGHMNGHHGLYTKGNATVPQNFYEESIRVPCLIQWPGRIRSGVRCPQVVNHCDLYQTLLEAAGAAEDSRANNDSFPGQSFFQALKKPGGQDGSHPMFCEYGNARMIRKGRYKYIRRYAPHDAFGDELYDLQDDPRERVNRIGRDADIAAGLRKELDAHFAQFEIPELSGSTVLSQKSCNPCEPWRQKRPEVLDPEGADMKALRHVSRLKPKGGEV